MTLDVEQIKELILNPANADMITRARKYADKLNMHINGIGLDDYIKQINNYENADQYELRQRYKRSNKAMFKNILQPLTKVYHTRGGAKYYNLPESREKQFKEILNSLSGKTIQQWIEKIWGKKKLTDPTGIIFIEISEDGMNAYPTYKSIHSIYDIQFTDTKPEYVIYEPDVRIDNNGEEDITVEIFRVVDDAYDYIFEKKNEVVTLIEEQSFPNFFEVVPAKRVSSETDENYGHGLSFIDASVEIANECIDDNSIKNIFKKMHGFPAYWEYERACLHCGGDKFVDGKKCPVCNGTGVRHKKDVSDITTVPVAEGGDPANPTPPAGYVSPDLEAWQQMNDELDYLAKAIHYTLWGTHAIENKAGETATGRFLDVEPVYSNLSLMANEAESMEMFITDLMGYFYFGNTYQGATIIYGRRYQLESPDEILSKLGKMKTDNIPENITRNKYMEYLQSEYANDSYEMTKQIKLFNLDPYPLYTAAEMSTMNLMQEEIFRNLYYIDWSNTVNDNDLLFIDIETLKTQRDEYIKTKLEIINLKQQENAKVQGNSNPAFTKSER